MPGIDDHEAEFWVRQIRLGVLIAVIITLLGAVHVAVNWVDGQRWWAAPMAVAGLSQSLIWLLPWRRLVHSARVRAGLFGWWLAQIPLLCFFAYVDVYGAVLYLPCVMLMVVTAGALFPPAMVVGLGVLSLAGFLALLPTGTGVSAVLVAGLASVMAFVVAVSAVIAHNRRRMDDRRRSAERRTGALLQNSPEAVIAIGRDGEVTYASPSAQTVLGHPAAAVTGELLSSLVHPEDLARMRTWMAALRSSPAGATDEAETRLRRADGSWAVLDAIGTNCLHDPDLEAVVISIRDIGARKALEEQLSRQAFTDPLTGLSNRALFRDRLEHATARRDAGVTLLLIDLDDFKDVNDNLGHSAGDELLTSVAGRLRSGVRPGDTLARLGGDEFAVLIESMDGRDASATAERLLTELRRPIELGGCDIRCTASIGVAAAVGGVTAEELLRNADLAMYAAKRQGRNAYAVFDEAMYASVINEARQRMEMERALAEEQFVVHYQPVVDLPHQRVTGVEALVRWQHPERGLLAPNHFIDNAEESGLIVPLGRWVLQEACHQLARWQADGYAEGLTMNVNLSARQFQYAGLVGDVRDAIASSGVEAGLLTLELTESMLLQDIDAASETLHALRRLGVHLAIDDFGTGYSSLNYLKRLPVDVIKIDRAFIAEVATDAGDKTLVDAVVTLSRALSLKTVAEGIETDDQQAMLHLLGCEYGQGYLFGRPAGPEAIASLLREHAEVSSLHT
ncbi:putative bifunctional diguanylate cyclase/phosphodiesterase [Actinoplanes aureus]|uniref:EAL domain-containing protein n=1 Tax=Actinoplanes aureus TaxID=2792083 RepID=A0A931C9C2_9ACTN|nr:EAL domain-containing protein [Actinoplanes aureus]MBG0565839.1 EAL domain-containing protein [Actinoplanes aureus]